MNLSEILKPEAIDLEERSFRDKEELFRHMAGMLQKNGFVEDAALFVDALRQREKTGSTYMGNLLAVPHGRSRTVVKNAAAFCRCKPFLYQSNDEEGEVRLVMMLAVSEAEAEKEYLRVLASFSRLMLNEEFYELLQSAQRAEEIVACGERILAQLADV